MLISRVEDEKSTEGQKVESDQQEYQTADELFDLMESHPCEYVTATVSTRDLVILYKNIDLGTNPVSNPDESKIIRSPNQYVETVIYNDGLDSENSEVEEVYSNEELRDVFMVNKERLDFFNSAASLENTLCQKLGGLEIQASDLSLPYDQHFLFKDHYIKEQLKNLSRVDAEFDGSTFPASLLDYICCKRLDDDYNFYMDNVIRYVKHTIEQLKRISNGDYLTDKAKEKWRKVQEFAAVGDDTEVLASSNSIPLAVERKVTHLSTKWNETIHSEVDVRSLSKILEKKIVVEVPKLICESFRFFTKLCSENLIISCKSVEKKIKTEGDEEPQCLMLQISRSEMGRVKNNVHSIIIMQPSPPVLPVEFSKEFSLPGKVTKGKVDIIEIPEIKENIEENIAYDMSSEGTHEDQTSSNDDTEDNLNILEETKYGSLCGSGDSNITPNDINDYRSSPDMLRNEAYNCVPTEEFPLYMLKSNMSSLPEEISEDMPAIPINNKKSQPKVRIKSPYENKSHMIDEKKRKKLLEIRERREKKKIAMGENCKIFKHKYGKGALPPQHSNSVTKLSISNKSFYNSIYGKNMNLITTENKGRKSRTDIDRLEGESESSLRTTEKNKKYFKRNYLDDPVTEIMYTDLKHSDCGSVKDIFGSTSEISDDSNNTTQITESPKQKLNRSVDSSSKKNLGFEKNGFDDSIDSYFNQKRIKNVSSSISIPDVPVPTNSPKGNCFSHKKANSPSVECRKSIDKLYDLIKTIPKVDSVDPKSSEMHHMLNKTILPVEHDCDYIAQGSESGTSIKHQLTVSHPNSFSFENIQNSELNKSSCSTKHNTVIPKVIISAKDQSVKGIEKAGKNHKKVIINPLPKVSDNPLKAISQLLHEFDNVQKFKHKPSSDPKPDKKSVQPQSSFESRNTGRQEHLRKHSHLDQAFKLSREKETRTNETVDSKSMKKNLLKERRMKTNIPIEPRKMNHQQVPIEGNQFNQVTKKRISDILDEVKEAKGEAVRGPSKLNSRLNSLAQPKKSYMQSHSQENQTKYGRNSMVDRLQRQTVKHTSRAKTQRSPEAVSSVSMRTPPVQPIERASHLRRPASSSPEAGRPSSGASCKQSHATDKPHIIKNKMVAVESYVKSHFGRSSPVSAATDLLRARVSLVPNDLHVVTMQSSPAGGESASVGGKHHIICTTAKPKPTPLAALLELQESSSKGDTNQLHIPLADDYSQGPPSSVDSDFHTDIFGDKNVKTAVQTFEDKLEDPIAEEESEKSCNSSVELQNLEAIRDRLTMEETIQKTRRINKLTLTPKHSTQQVLALESGDAGSIILNTNISKSLIFNHSQSYESLKMLVSLKNANLDWNFTNIPKQVASVGYAFPEYYMAKDGLIPKDRNLNNIFKLHVSISSCSTKDKKSSKTSQCIKDIPKSNDMRDVKVVPENGSKEAIPKSFKEKLTTVSLATDVNINHAIDMICGDSADIKNLSATRLDVEELKMKENIDCTSSLDMLVGLLNEIQKITTCHMINTDIFATEQERNEIETLFKDAAMNETVKYGDSHELLSIASLDKMRQLKYSSSILSLCLSNEDKDLIINRAGGPRLNITARNDFCENKLNRIDKEVSTDFPQKEFIDTYTDVPSKIFSITHVSSSLIGILSKPSSQTIISLDDSEDLDSAYILEKNVVDTTKSNVIHDRLIFEYPNTRNETQKYRKKIPNKVKATIKKYNLFHDQTKQSVKSSESFNVDPMIKIKRDILVTVYSVLVLTVFAALSFPEIVYHV